MLIESFCFLNPSHVHFPTGLTDDILLGIFRRGCKNLTSLDLSAHPFLLTEFAVHCIGKTFFILEPPLMCNVKKIGVTTVLTLHGLLSCPYSWPIPATSGK